MSSLVITGGASFGLVLGWSTSLLMNVPASRREGLLLLLLLAAGGEVYTIAGAAGLLALVIGFAVGWALRRAFIFLIGAAINAGQERK
jgi:hypothetical protein